MAEREHPVRNIGLVGALALWSLLRDMHGKAPAPTTATSTSTTRACALRLDTSGLTADGARVSVADAVARCKAVGRADVTVAESAPAQTYADLLTALGRAGVPTTAQRNARKRLRIGTHRNNDGRCYCECPCPPPMPTEYAYGFGGPPPWPYVTAAPPPPTVDNVVSPSLLPEAWGGPPRPQLSWAEQRRLFCGPNSPSPKPAFCRYRSGAEPLPGDSDG